jgi:dTDP-D-glucose 4,6-dehydratase
MSEYTKTALVLGAGGFIGSHMVKRLRSEGYWVRGVDLKYPEFSLSEANEFVQGDLRDVSFVRDSSSKENKVIFIIQFLIGIFVHLMRSISLLLIWVVQDLYLLVRMMQTLCTTLQLLI